MAGGHASSLPLENRKPRSGTLPTLQEVNYDDSDEDSDKTQESGPTHMLVKDT